MLNDTFHKRKWLLVLLTILVAIIYIIRLAGLQLFDSEYQQRANNNAYLMKKIYPVRGLIKDRNGAILVSNEASYDLMIEMRIAKNSLDTTALASILKIDKSYIIERLEYIKDRKKNRSYSPYVPQVLISQLSENVVGAFREQLYRFPGFSIQDRSIRKYEYNHAANILGYLSEANTRDIENDESIAPGDYVGRGGVERTYEKILRGKKGIEILLRDAKGHIKGRYNDGKNDSLPENGSDLVLSIDSALQSFGESLMKGKQGAIVAIEPSSGEILAMVDGPNYDPALLTGKELGANMKKLENTAGKPLYSKSIMGTYPPGSTFKLLQAGIFLKEGVIKPTSMFSCYHGYPPLGNRPKCHTHGSPLSLVPAIATSCNSYFSYGLHYMLDDRKFYPNVQTAMDHWKDWVVKLGFGYRLGVDLPGEKRGYIPNSSVYDKVYKSKWNAHSIISISIGQGEILATPLQMANMGAIIANRGYFYTPHVVKSISNSKIDTTYTNRKESGIEPNIWETVVDGMAAAVTGGTARAANFAPGKIVVCGKTGTAQNPHGKDHSAFVGFAPRQNPQIVVAVYIVNGGFGATYGVPIGRLMMEYYLNKGILSESSKEIKNSMQSKIIVYGKDH